MIKLDQLAKYKFNDLLSSNKSIRVYKLRYAQLCMCVTISAMAATNCEMCPIERQHQSSYYQLTISRESSSYLCLLNQTASLKVLPPSYAKISQPIHHIIYDHAMAMHFCAIFTLNDISRKISSFTITRRNATKGHDNEIPICFHFLSLSFKFPQIMRYEVMTSTIYVGRFWVVSNK